MVAFWLFVGLCCAGEFSPSCPSDIDDGFVDHIFIDDENLWQTTLSDETLAEIRDVISERGPLTTHQRTLTSHGVQCWYKMPMNSQKKLEFVIQNYQVPTS